MKRPILVLLAAGTLTSAVAQTDKGSVMVGAGIADVNAGLHEGGDKIDYFSFSIHPKAGYFVINNLAIGASAGFGFSKSGRFKAFSYGAEPFVRYYLGSKKTKMFGEGSIGYYRDQFTNAEPSFPRAVNQLTYSIGPGVAHFISDNVSIESSLMLRGVKNTTFSTTTYLPSLNFGFNIYLHGLKKKAEKTIE